MPTKKQISDAAYRERNREKIRASHREWRAAHPNAKKASEYALKTRYGITKTQFDAMLSSQGNSCAICGTKEPGGSGTAFHVDHCHTTKKVRGLLCNLCNIGLGAFRDSPAALRGAASYLEGPTS